MAQSQQQQRTILLVVVATLSAGLMVWHFSRAKQPTPSPSSSSSKPKSKPGNDTTSPKGPTTPTKPKHAVAGTTTKDADPTPRRTNSSLASANTTTNDADDATLPTHEDTEKRIHAKIEQLDKKGKEFFKEKKYMEAAQEFTKALDFMAHNADGIAEPSNTTEASSGMMRQTITLLNNRSAMYEKALIHELALADCDTILEAEPSHTKARTRKLRVLESLKRYPEALQEVCAAQLLFMQAHKVNLRMGLPVPPPPVPQAKMEQILNEILPTETLKYVQALEHRNATTSRLPGTYTILQLLRSYTEYNAWMALAAKEGSVEQLTKELESSAPVSTAADTSAAAAAADSSPATVAHQLTLLFKRGRRHVYDRKYEEATVDFEHALALAEEHTAAINALPEGVYARLLEWTGMVRHWHYDLDSALQCLEKAATIEPKNSLLIVKQAGVKLDAGQHDDALKLFDRALEIDAGSADALLHRSNMHILQTKLDLAKADLDKCLKLRPSYTLARLRLAAVCMQTEDIEAARKQVDLADRAEPNSSEVHSYRGELHFSLGEMDEALREFEIAIQHEPLNPTPYVNAGLALGNSSFMNTSQVPDTSKILRYFEKAIAVDPQFTAAYVHLGQLKLGTATALQTAREVVTLYDRGLEQCRTAEEIKELCGMRALALAQVDAAAALKMDTFNFQ